MNGDGMETNDHGWVIPMLNDIILYAYINGYSTMDDLNVSIVDDVLKLAKGNDAR